MRGGSESPLKQLVKLKLGRMLYGANADSEEIEGGIGVALTLLTLPGAFLSLLLFNKYGSLLRLLRGQVKFDPYAASLPDEYLFIVLAMLVSGGVALWKWDSLFLDRRDTVNIVPLPIATRQIFAASLLAISLLALIFCVDVNAASAVLFPLVVSASQESFLFFGKIALGHVSGILAASLFSFATVFAIAGVFLAMLSTRAFHAISLLLRAVIAVALLLLLASAFTVSQDIAHGVVASHTALHYLPSIWFLGVCQRARGVAGPLFRHFAFTGLLALLIVMAVGALAYGLAYGRHFAGMAEASTERRGSWAWNLNSTIGRMLDRTVLRTSFEQAGFRFVLRSLLRSDRPRFAAAVFLAIGVVTASQLLPWSGVAIEEPTTAQYAAPLIILYCCILGLRFTFDLPVELNANWIFRFLIPPALEECAMLAGKAILLFVAPLMVVMAAVFGLRWRLATGLLEGMVSLALSATLIAGLVLTFRKLPFTCAKAGFQHRALVTILLYVLGGVGFAIVPAGIEHWANPSPVRLLVLAPLLGAAWWGIRLRRAEQLDIERQIVFRDANQNELELLNLNA